MREEVERFLRRLGYRLVLKELRHPKQMKRGEELHLAMKWQNRPVVRLGIKGRGDDGWYPLSSIVVIR